MPQLNLPTNFKLKQHSAKQAVNTEADWIGEIKFWKKKRGYTYTEILHLNMKT